MVCADTDSVGSSVSTIEPHDIMVQMDFYI